MYEDPLKKHSPELFSYTNLSFSYPPLVDHCKLQVRMNIKEKRVELRSSKYTVSNEALQMGADFVSAFAMGFDIDDAIALLRLDSLYIQSFDIKDVRQTLGMFQLHICQSRLKGRIWLTLE